MLDPPHLIFTDKHGYVCWRYVLCPHLICIDIYGLICAEYMFYAPLHLSCIDVYVYFPYCYDLCLFIFSMMIQAMPSTLS